MPRRTHTRAMLAASCLGLVPAFSHAQQPITDGFGGVDGLPHSGLIREALRHANLTPDQFTFDRHDVALWGGDKYRLPVFDLFFHDTWKIAPFSRIFARQAAEAAARPGSVAYVTQSRTGVRVRDNPYGSWAAGIAERVDELGDRSLAVAISELAASIEGDHATPTPEQVQSMPGYADVPREVRRAAAIILLLTAEAHVYRELGLTRPIASLGLDHQAVYEQMYASLFWEEETDLPLTAQAERTLRTESILDAVDFHMLYKGANTLLMGVDLAVDEFTGERARRLAQAEARERLEAGELDAEAADAAIASATAPDVIGKLARADDFAFACDTPLGRVLLNGSGDNLYEGEQHALLIIDTGGDDTYRRAAATPDYRHGFALAIDLSGNDTYESPDTPAWKRLNEQLREDNSNYRHARPGDGHAPAFGAGVCGYGVLLDFRGDDSYATPFGGQGAAVLGFGMLWDAQGDDRYTGDRGVQGSATFGSAVLADLEGDDRYHAFGAAQGYAYTLGSGLLVDTHGDDAYIAETEVVKYRWFGTHPEQLNLSQGFGFGRRADYGDGHSWAGGVGMIVDTGAGDDTYHCDIFGIGCAYWYALGIAFDDGGDDDYTSHAYAIASPPHFAIGVVLDEAGDDTYRGASSRVCGFGRDFSIGWFEDLAGNDTYYANDSGFGVGNVNGLGFFLDHAGDDTYVAFANSFGAPFIESSGSQRDIIVNAGLFIDAQGTDRYLQMPEAVREGFPEALGERKADFRFTEEELANFPAYADVFSTGAYENVPLENGGRVSREDVHPHASSTGAFVDRGADDQTDDDPRPTNADAESLRRRINEKRNKSGRD